jgi:glutathione S-transferase
MRLLYSAASPFARKARVTALELGLADKIELVPIATTPIKPDPKLEAVNPIRKIPALVLDDGTALFESLAVCEYLDAEHGGNRLLPASGPGRWKERRIEALATGITDAAVLVVLETRLRPEANRWPDWIDAQLLKVNSGLDMLEAEAPDFGDGTSIGRIAVGCALGYLGFRFPDLDWRTGRPALAAWFDTFDARPAMAETRPG